MRFNDYHKDVCRLLELTAEADKRAVRTDVMRCYARGLTATETRTIIAKLRDIQAAEEAAARMKRGLTA